MMVIESVHSFGRDHYPFDFERSNLMSSTLLIFGFLVFAVSGNAHSQSINPTANRSHAAVLADDPCTMANADLPPLRGFRLGMARNAAEAKLKGISTSVDFRWPNADANALNIRYLLATTATGDFKGVAKIEFVFLDDKVVLFRVIYAYDGTDWSGKLHKLTGKFAEVFGIPITSWKVNGWTGSTSCSDFSIIVGRDVFMSVAVTVETLDYESVIKTREQEAERRRQQDFKP
jgi:hypothetical protein